MPHFLELTFSFPVVVFSFLLCVVIFYWVLACFGLIDVEALNPDALQSDGVHLEGAAGLLLKVGLAGVPISIVFTLLTVLAWFFSYFMQLLVLEPLSLGFFYYPLGVLLAMVAFMAAVPVTSSILRLLRPLLRKHEAISTQSILGQVAVVRSSIVSEGRGEAMFDDGGAGLILQVRTADPAGFKRGDRVVLLEYMAGEHLYQVIGEAEFKGLSPLRSK